MASYAMMVYIEPEDVYNKLSDEDKVKYKEVIFTDVSIESDGSVDILCRLTPRNTDKEEENVTYNVCVSRQKMDLD